MQRAVKPEGRRRPSYGMNAHVIVKSNDRWIHATVRDFDIRHADKKYAYRVQLENGESIFIAKHSSSLIRPGKFKKSELRLEVTAYVHNYTFLIAIVDLK